MTLDPTVRDLPPGAPPTEGQAPNAPGYAEALVAPLLTELAAEPDRAMATTEARIRHSWSGDCARAIAYRVLGVEQSEPLTVADHWRFWLGKVVHDALQARLVDAGWEHEVPVAIDDLPSAGHVDTLRPGAVVELKTINGFGYKQAIGARGRAEGPRWKGVVQASVNAHALALGDHPSLADAQTLDVVIVHASLELLSPREAAKLGADELARFVSAWRYDQETWLPIATAEVRRWRKILLFVDEGRAVPRHVPGMPNGATVVDPAKGNWTLADGTGRIVEAGSTWHCSYCAFRTRCAADAAEGR